jgi:HK97 family phage prohead protease
MATIQIQGYALLFNSPYPFTEKGQGYIEEIDPGALKNADFSDVKLLRDHNQSLLIASTKSGTLRLKVDAVGLFFSADVPDTIEGKDTAELIRKKILNQTSFGFSTLGGDGSKWSMFQGTPVRRIMKIAKLFDVSVVTFPANPKTSVWLKEAAASNILQLQPITQKPTQAMNQVHQANELKAAHVARLEAAHQREYITFLQATQPPVQQPAQQQQRAGMYKLASLSATYECANDSVKNDQRRAMFAKASDVREQATMSPDDIAEKRIKQAQQVGGDLWAKMQEVRKREYDLSQICAKDREFLQQLNNGRR